VIARRLTTGAEAIAQGKEDVKFKSYLIAHQSTQLTQAENLPNNIKEMSFTFGSKGSTSGRLMPQYYLSQHFQQPVDELFSRIGFSGNHSRTIALVQSGAYQLGAVNYQVWEKELSQGKIDPTKVKVIWSTPEYPDYHWTVHGNIDEKWGAGFKEKLTKAILDIKSPELLDAFPRSAFIPAKNADYIPIEKTANAIGLLGKNK
jgi:phosphonate transport system substrate-binding protein